VEVNLTSGGVVNGLISANSAFQSGYVVQATCPNGKTTTYIFENWYFTDGNGTQHYLPSTFYVDNESQLARIIREDIASAQSWGRSGL
jgi:hypothetical protein